MLLVNIILKVNVCECAVLYTVYDEYMLTDIFVQFLKYFLSY